MISNYNYKKISYESKENAINVDSLKDVNQELISELQELRKNLLEVRLAQKDSLENEKERKKAQKLAQIMFKLDPSVNIYITFIFKLHEFNCSLILFRVK